MRFFTGLLLPLLFRIISNFTGVFDNFIEPAYNVVKALRKGAEAVKNDDKEFDLITYLSSLLTNVTRLDELLAAAAISIQELLPKLKYPENGTPIQIITKFIDYIQVQDSQIQSAINLKLASLIARKLAGTEDGELKEYQADTFVQLFVLKQKDHNND